MKLGAASTILGIKSDTVVNWIDRYKEFLSPEARKVGVLQRDITDDDLLVLNTIRAERARNTEWDVIEAVLRGGQRESQFPPETKFMQQSPIELYQNTLAIQQKLNDALHDLNVLEERLAEAGVADRAKQERIEELLQKLGKQEGIIEVLREMLSQK